MINIISREGMGDIYQGILIHIGHFCLITFGLSALIFQESSTQPIFMFLFASWKWLYYWQNKFKTYTHIFNYEKSPNKLLYMSICNNHSVIQNQARRHSRYCFKNNACVTCLSSTIFTAYIRRNSNLYRTKLDIIYIIWYFHRIHQNRGKFILFINFFHWKYWPQTTRGGYYHI